jgi:hypothetical protein
MLLLKNIVLSGVILLNCQLPVFGQQSRQWTEQERAFLVQELEQTRQQLTIEVISLRAEQVNFREAPNRWSILEIVEHLEVQDEMYWRELDILTRGPTMPQVVERVRGNDEKLLHYETDPGKADAGYRKPIGQFGTKELAMQAFDTVRHRMTRILLTGLMKPLLCLWFAFLFSGVEALFAQEIVWVDSIDTRLETAEK